MDIDSYTKTNLLSGKLSTEIYAAGTVGTMVSDLSTEVYGAINTAMAGVHTHDNMAVLSGISANDITAWNSAEQNAKDYADGLASNYDAAGAAAQALVDAKDYVDQGVAATVTTLLSAAPEEFNTLKEIADWIEADTTGTTALINRVTAVESTLSDCALSNDVDSRLGNKVDVTDFNAVSTDVETISTDLETVSNDVSSVSADVDDLKDLHTCLNAAITTLTTDGSINTIAIINKVNELIGLLNAHLSADFGGTPAPTPYQGPYYLAVNGTPISPTAVTDTFNVVELSAINTRDGSQKQEWYLGDDFYTIIAESNCIVLYLKRSTDNPSNPPSTIAHIDYDTAAITNIGSDVVTWTNTPA